MRKVIVILGAILLGAALAGGSFYGGMVYQRNQSNAIRDSFLRSRGLEGAGPGSGNFPGPGQAGAPGGNFMGRGMTGQVKSLEGNTLTLSTPQNDLKVTLSADTSIQVTVAGATSDIQAGQQVMVTGERDADGNLTAEQITIMNNGTNPATSEDTP
jgi:hypothetical protein